MSKTLARAILDCKCPRCREGELFKSMPFSKWFDREMYKECDHCGQTYEPEPGFYYGAMFVSYAFSVAITFVSIFTLYNFFGDPEMWVYLLTVTMAVLVCWPLMYRYSRAIYLHLFGGIRFDSKYSDSK